MRRVNQQISSDRLYETKLENRYKSIVIFALSSTYKCNFLGADNKQ